MSSWKRLKIQAGIIGCGSGGSLILRPYFKIAVGNGKFFGFWFFEIIWHYLYSGTDEENHHI
jgi:hypothetical protein